MLPQEFTERMKGLLGEEYEKFAACLDGPRHQALRVNSLKKRGQENQEELPFHLTPVPWAESGYYYEAGEQPGRHPFHEAGVYYIQEPSAMAPAGLLAPQPGERVLDLCAAPGGKSTQIAAQLGGEGLLICNEIHPARARILSENIERMGVRNAIVTNESPLKLSQAFPLYFDRIMVDAPCSGEGMFRKNEEAREEWSLENVRLCAERQTEILDCAAMLLRPGGRLVYSTCTFAPEENEGSVAAFLKRHPEFSVEAPILPHMEAVGGIGTFVSPGRPKWAAEAVPGLDRTVRLWPHRLKGEGHFAAVLQKGISGGRVKEEAGKDREDLTAMLAVLPACGLERGLAEKELPEYLEFSNKNIMTQLSGIYLRFGDQLYLAPEGTPSLRGLKVIRPGLHLGTLKKNRFEPSHALALALAPEEVRNSLNLSSQGQEIRSYLGGGTFSAEGEKGWHLITVDGYSIGWGKLAGGVMKNHYPKGLRKFNC